MEEKQLGMRWFNAYSVLLFLRIIGGILSFLLIAYTCFRYVPNINSLTIMAIVLAEVVFSIITYIQFSNNTELGYTLNAIYLFAEVIVFGVTEFFFGTSGNRDAGNIIGIFVTTGFLLLVWSLPNYNYFKKRRYLFSGTLKEKKEQHAPVLASEKYAQVEPAAKGEDSNNSNMTEQARVKEPKSQDSAIPVDTLKTLKELHEDGVLTDEEFAEKKRQVLGI